MKYLIKSRRPERSWKLLSRTLKEVMLWDRIPKRFLKHKLIKLQPRRKGN
uniref:Uncharacterized protein n=1 Tax=Picea sitchensis TaxID=3332 RepID=A9NVH8_PICSI|nr:unknown [Picea sitchensis]